MNLFEQITADIKKAMLNKDKAMLEALRAVKSALLIEKTKGASSELTKEEEIKILQRLVKQRRESAEIYKNQNRKELYDAEVYQADAIQLYLPKQLSDEELTKEIAEIIASVGASSMKDMGKVMGIAGKKLAGRAEGKIIADKVKVLLS
ncbi:MAG: GatB/YqeY domain-containing protein [Bacteroidetes bacterium]|nr:MAG: GatB/YqeY domain-containing protein [Bacteroidota bacterium]